MAESTPAQETQASAPDRRWLEKMATASSALIALGTLVNWFFGRQRTFPNWFFYVLTVFVLLIMYQYFSNTIRNAIQYWSARSFLRQQQYQLVDFIQRLGELVTLRAEDSIVLLHQKISDRQGRDVVDRDLFPYIDQFIANIMVRLSEPGRQLSAGEFKSVLNDIGSLIKFTSQFFFKKPLHSKGLSELTSDERKNLQLARENYADFVRRFQNFYDEVHARLGSSTRAHFEIPKPLSD